VTDTRWLAMIVWAAVGCGAESAPTTTAIPCTVVAHAGAESTMLVGEARAARAARQSASADFTLAVPGASSIELQLTAVGCNCYQVQHGARSLKVGDHVVIPSGSATRVQIVAQPTVEPGIRHYHAEFSGRRSDGTPFSFPLTHAIRTRADVVVRPDVLHVDVKPRALASAERIPVLIEQHVRADSTNELSAVWDELPSGLAATVPFLLEPPTEVSTGLWRVRWRSSLSTTINDLTPAEQPWRLPIVSRQQGREVARTSCMLIARRQSGISAPALVHFGRLSPASAAVRRVQLRALDDVSFAISSVGVRAGGVDVRVTRHVSLPEHWLELRAEGSDEPISDVLTIETDHPASPRLQIAVRALAAQSADERVSNPH